MDASELAVAIFVPCFLKGKAVVVCPNCDSQQPDGASYCDQCGGALRDARPAAPAPPTQIQLSSAMEVTTCSTCGANVMPGDAFCSSCGAALNSPATLHPPSPQADTLLCSNCGEQLTPGSNFCDMCGAPVDAAPQKSIPSETPRSPTLLLSPRDYPLPSVVRGQLVVQETGTTLPFPLGKTEVILGRQDPVGDVLPDIDLVDHGGEQGGVSRRHARIFVQNGQLFIQDLNSTNYTYVNQKPLIPEHPHPINDGDEIQLGQVKLCFYR